MSAILQYLLSAFYLGHSLVSPNLPEMMYAVLDDRVEFQLINGAPLEINWNDSATAQGVDGRKWLAANPVDAIVITERVPVLTTMQWHHSADYAAKWVELAAKTNPHVKSYLYATWDDIDDAQTGTTRTWRDRIVSDMAHWQAIANDTNAKLPQLEMPMRIVPAGLGMVRLHDAIAEGKVPDSTSIRDFFHDDIHPNHNGFYYVTMIHYAALTGKSPVGLPSTLMGAGGPYPPVPKDMALMLQQLAQETVEEFRAKGG